MSAYQAKSIRGAQTEVRRLRKQVASLAATVERYHADRIALAKLAAYGPCFFNPLDVWAAEKVRDEILKTWCNLNPDGTPI